MRPSRTRRSIAACVLAVASRVSFSVPAQRTSFRSSGPSTEIPTFTLVLLEQTNVPIVDERSIGLDPVAAESLVAEGPQLFEHAFRHEQRLPPEDRETRTGSSEALLHLFEVECRGDIAGVTLRVLVAVPDTGCCT